MENQGRVNFSWQIQNEQKGGLWLWLLLSYSKLKTRATHWGGGETSPSVVGYPGPGSGDAKSAPRPCLAFSGLWGQRVEPVCSVLACPGAGPVSFWEFQEKFSTKWGNFLGSVETCR